MAQTTVSAVFGNIGAIAPSGAATSSVLGASALVGIPAMAIAPAILPLSVALIAGSLAAVASGEMDDLMENATEAFDGIGEGLADLGLCCCDAIVDGLDVVEEVLCDAADTVGDICGSIGDFFTGW
jgi:hypothetical protein